MEPAARAVRRGEGSLSWEDLEFVGNGRRSVPTEKRNAAASVPYRMSAALERALRPQIDLRQWVIDLPVKPEVFERRDMPQSFSLQDAAYRSARKIPLTPGLAIKQIQGGLVRLQEEIVEFTIHSAIKAAKGFSINVHDNEERQVPEGIHYRVLFFEGFKRIGLCNPVPFNP
jgi:hypothetical protein